MPIRSRNPRRGRIPPHLRPFLFKKGHKKIRAKRKRRANPGSRSGQVIAAKVAGQTMVWEGNRFKRAQDASPVIFPTVPSAQFMIKRLRGDFPKLRRYHLFVRSRTA